MLYYVITLSVLIIAVILIRAIFRKKIPPVVMYAMWLAVVVRMCIPMPLLKIDMPVLLEREITDISTVGGGVKNEAPSTNHGTVVEGDASVSGEGGVVYPYIPPQGGGTVIDNPTQGDDAPVGNTPNLGDTPSVVYPYTPSDDPVQGSVGGEDLITPPITEITPEVPREDIVPVEPATPDIVNIDVPRILKTVWVAGSAVMAVAMLVSALVFQIRARRDRQYYRTIHKTKVYVSENVGGPCLAGLIPAIYLTPENAYSESNTLTMIHEYTHLRHGDYIWSAVRAIALIVHWWNPLVWAAAILSKHDAELAVDAAVTKKLNEEKKLEYARIIVDTIPVRGAHAIGLGSGQIKERILMITSSQKNRVIAVILAIAICLGAIGCAFVGRSDDGPNDFTIEPTEVYELPIEAPEGEVILQAASYGDTFLLGSECITIDGLNGDAKVANISAGADGEGYIVFGCGTYDPQAKPTERRPHFTAYHTYRVVCEDRKIIEVEEVDTITSADVLEHGKPYTGTLDGQYECSRASVFDGLLLYYGILIDGNYIRIKSGAFTSGGSGPKTGTFTYDINTGTIIADLSYEKYDYETDSTETISETVSGKLLEYKGMVHFVSDAENASPLPLTFSPDACVKSEGIYVRTNEGYDILIIDNKPYKMDGETAFSELNTGDKISVIHSAFRESYLGSPTKTMDGAEAFIVRKIADGDISDVPSEAIVEMRELGLVIMNYGLTLPEELLRILDMKAGEIRAEFDEMKLEYSEYGPGQPVYKIDGLPGIHAVYHHTNMDDPITDDRYAGELIVDGGYTDGIFGMKIGDDIADIETGITWNEAWYDVINGTVHVRSEFGEHTLEVNMKVADGIGLPDESTATEDDWAKWSRSFAKEPRGEILNFRLGTIHTTESTLPEYVDITLPEREIAYQCYTQFGELGGLLEQKNDAPFTWRIHASKNDGTTYIVFGYKNIFHTVEFIGYITYQVEHKDGKIVSCKMVDNVVDLDFENVCKPYTGSLDGHYEAMIQQYGNSYQSMKSYEITISGNDVVVDYSVSSFGTEKKKCSTIFKGKFTYDEKTGKFEAKESSETDKILRATIYEHNEFIIFYDMELLIHAHHQLSPASPIWPVVALKDASQRVVPVPGGDSYVMEDPMDFFPPEAASRGKSVQVGDSYFISYHTYTEEPSVYVALRLENGNYLMMKTALPEEDFVCDGFIKDMWDSGNGSAIAIVRRYQIGLACYTDLVCELSLDTCNDAHNDQLDAYYNNRDVYKIPTWELVERKFIFDETAIGAYLTDNAKVVFVKQLLNSPHFLYFCTNEAGTEFMLYHLYANIWGSNPDIGEIERLDVKLPESVKYDTVVPVEYTTGGGSMECKFYLRLMRGSEIFYVSFDNFAWETSEDVLDFEYKGIITEKEQRELAGMYPDIFEAPATIVNVAVTAHDDADCEIIFDEDSLESGMFTRFTLKAGDRTVDFEGRQLNYKDADIYASDLTGDGVNDYTVVFTWGTGTSVLEREVHVFDGATLREIAVSSPEDYLDENLVQSFDGEKYTLKLDGAEYVIEKSRLVTPSAQESDRVGTNSHITYHVNDKGELIAVIGCMIGMGEYVGVIEIEYGYTEAGELRPVHAKYIDTLSLEYGMNSYYDSIRGK